MRARMIQGTIKLKPADPASGSSAPASPDQGCVLHIYVEDVARMDAPAEKIATAELTLDQLPQPGEPIPFAVSLPETTERARLNVRIHVDRSASGDVAEGDFITMQSYPVSEDDDSPMEIEARQV